VVGWLKLCVGTKEMKSSNLINDIAFHDYILYINSLRPYVCMSVTEVLGGGGKGGPIEVVGDLSATAFGNCSSCSSSSIPTM
jgi:hypothetical protein